MYIQYYSPFCTSVYSYEVLVYTAEGKLGHGHSSYTYRLSWSSYIKYIQH